MILRNDDELSRVDNEYLGPPGSDWPRARYIAYVIAAGTLVVLMAVEHRIGVRISAISVLYTLALTVGITRWIGKRITHETPFRVLPVIGRNELTAPRELHYVNEATLHPCRIPVRDVTPRRRHRG